MTPEALSDAAAGATAPLDWRSILPVCLIAALYAAGMAAVLPVLPFYVRELGGSALVFGIVVAIEALGQFCSAPLLGQLADRYGRKRVLLASQMVAAVSLLLLACAPNLAFVLLARALFGMTSGNLSAAIAYIADHSTARNRRQAISILTGATGLGGILGAGLAGLLSDTDSTAPIYAALALTLLAIAVAYFQLGDSRAASSPEDHAPGKRISFRALGSPVLRILVIVMLCHFFAYGMYASQMPVFLADTFIWNGHAFGARELSYILAADGLINVLVQLCLLGWLSKYFTERNLILLIFALVCIGFLAAGFAATIPALAFAIACISTSDALAKPTYLAALSVHVPPQRQGVIMGTAQALVAVTDVASPVLGGFILSYALYGVWIGVAVAVALAGAILTMARIPGSAQTGAPDISRPSKAAGPT